MFKTFNYLKCVLNPVFIVFDLVLQLRKSQVQNKYQLQGHTLNSIIIISYSRTKINKEHTYMAITKAINRLSAILNKNL
jgi:hypothetical protein